MNTTAFAKPEELTDQDLLAAVSALAAGERQATALLVAYLAELDARRLYLAEGYSSLFAFCTEGLYLSEHEAYNRIEAARVSRRFPILLDKLVEGALSLTMVRLLAPHLTLDNHVDLIARVAFKGKRAVEELVASLAPRPTIRASVRRLPEPQREATEELAKGEAEAIPVFAEQSISIVAPLRRRTATATPTCPNRCNVQFTASSETFEKLQQARALLRHQIPDGDLDQILSRALTALLEKLASRKFGAADRPRVSRAPQPNSRHIPAAVRRAVWLRDGGRCAYIAANGRRCAKAASSNSTTSGHLLKAGRRPLRTSSCDADPIMRSKRNSFSARRG